MSEINDKFKVMLDELLVLKQRDICADAHVSITMIKRDINTIKYYPYNITYTCPSCKKVQKIPDGTMNADEVNFCANCGQRVKIRGYGFCHTRRIEE